MKHGRSFAVALNGSTVRLIEHKTVANWLPFACDYGAKGTYRICHDVDLKMPDLTTDDCMDAGDRATQEAKVENAKNTGKYVFLFS